MIAAILCIRRNLSLGLPAMLQHIPVTHNSGFHNVKFHDTPIVLDINWVMYTVNMCRTKLNQ